jgi:drug/metabolite transporter (DMT)-like permease
MEEKPALHTAYLKLKKRWWIVLWLLVAGALWVALGSPAEGISFVLGLTFLVYWILCYVSQFLVIREMSDRVDHPRVDVKEQGFWYTMMLVSLLALAPGMLVEVGFFLLYAKRFIANAQIAEATHGQNLSFSNSE